MTSTMIKVTPVTSAVGAVLDGIDLREPLDEETVRFIRQAWLDHGVIFIHDQDLTEEQLTRFAGYFGRPAPDNGEPFFRAAEVTRDQAKAFVQKFGTLDGDHTGKTEVVAAFDTSAAAKSKMRSTDMWHSDTTGVAEPPMATMLRAVTIPSVGGDTLWSSQYAAYEALSPAFREFLDPLTAVHSMMPLVGRIRGSVPFSASDVEVTHPVVKVHPETGRKALYVNETWVTKIVELSDAESAHILAVLFDHLKSPDFNMRWHWTPNDVVFWDNRAVQHYAVHDYDENRQMQRIILQ
jgi:alpha-ketoglutarate-dependent taurine dioxygenase